MPNVLTLREYETARIGAAWDVHAKVVTDRDVFLLEQLQRETGQELFDIRRHSIKARNYVGTLSLGDHTLEILPKTDLANDQTRQRLIEMLDITRLVPFREVDIASQARHYSTLLDVFMAIFLRHLTIQWRRGRISSYRKVNANRTYLKGKLLFGEHIRQNIAHAERFFTRCDAFTVDVPISQVLKLAINICRRYASLNSIRREALSLLMEFDDVSDVRFDSLELERIKTDRQTDRFSSLLNLGKCLILGESPDRTANNSTHSLMFDMNVVFERYIAELTKRAFGSENQYALSQISGRHLLRRNGKGKFRLVPDIGIHDKGELVCLIDTKWKLLTLSQPHEGVSQADMYQMYAYAREFGCPRVILLYPRTMVLPGQVAIYHIGAIDGPRIEVWAVDITESPKQIVKQLCSLYSM